MTNHEMFEELMGNIGRFVIFAQVSPPAVKHKAEILATPGLNSHLIHSTEYNTRAVDAGWDEIKTISKNASIDDDGRKRTGTTEGVTYRKRTDTITEAHHRYVSYEDQKTDFERRITTLNVGECYVREGNRVFFHRVQMLEIPWKDLYSSRHPRIPLAETKLAMALETIKSRPEYRTAEIRFPPKRAGTTTKADAATPPSSNGSTTPTRFRRSSTSSRNATRSRNTKKRTDVPNDSSGEGN